MNLDGYVVLDVETQLLDNEVEGGWNNIEGMRLASAVVYDYATDMYYFFLDEQDLPRLREFLLLKNVITFNGMQFDSKVILGNDRKIEDVVTLTERERVDVPDYMKGCCGNDGLPFHWINIDLHPILVKSRWDFLTIEEALANIEKPRKGTRRFSLNSIAKGTLNIEKVGKGKDAPQLYKDGKIVELLQYNQQDVRITKQLWEFAVKHGYLVDHYGRKISLDRDYLL